LKPLGRDRKDCSSTSVGHMLALVNLFVQDVLNLQPMGAMEMPWEMP
jgi:hypothetical protein